MNRILLLEDDVSLIDGLVYSLKKNEFDVKVARTVCEAKQYLSELDRYDLLILDVTLPDGTGFDICEKVRKENQQMPIIFLTASDEEVSIIRGLDSGGDDYITKPFNTNLLISRCNNLVNSRRLLQEKFSKQPQAFAQMLATNPMDKEMLDRAMAIIEQHLDNTDFNVNIFARQMGMARTNLFTKLKAVTGQTPNDFILSIRLKKGAVMLRNNPELNITEISDRIGFSSSRYFSKCFKEIYHVSPLAYRKGEEKEEEGNEETDQ